MIVRQVLLFGFFVSTTLAYTVGDTVRDFQLRNVDGKMVALTQYATTGRGVIIVFTCNSCPYAKAYEERIIELHREFAPKGFPVLTIQPNDPERSPEDSYQKMQQRAAEKGYPFPYLWDETQEVARQFKARRTPHAYVLQRVGERLVVAYIGAIDDNAEDPGAVEQRYVAESVNALLRGGVPPVRETRAIGCTIKWRRR
ncbi:MAG: thioredoxin family protein [Candidatus Kapabacteria bacterium]|nr:thioredoxin family protein [Candidatus Kapabacteria bacterium]MDW8225319.1 thioredoxin family protein [Bacteroidota bacterium]